QRIDEAGKRGEIHGVLGHQRRTINTVVEQVDEAVITHVQAKGPFYLAVGGQLVKRRLVYGPEVDVATHDGRRGMDDADLEVGPFGRKAPFLLQRVDIGAGQSGFSRIMAPTQDIAVIRRPILGGSCGALTRRYRLSTRF